jgi:hypothetical protein
MILAVLWMGVLTGCAGHRANRAAPPPPSSLEKQKTQDADAVQRLRQQAEQGDVRAQFNLGVMYANAQGVPQDSGQAIQWYQRAAQQGYAPAQYNLGFMYAYGLGVPQDSGQAIQWYQRAAQQGYAPAQCNLGNMYLAGRGIPQDYGQAMQWYSRAAQQGYAPAQLNLGSMYAYGQGVPQDYGQAYFWFNLAAANVSIGTDREKAVHARNVVAARLTPIQLAEVQARARGWQPKADTPAPDPPALPSPQRAAAKRYEPHAPVEAIPLTDVHGVYSLPVEINGVLTLPFILDTGASDVLLPPDVALTLYRAGTIHDTDFLPGQTYVLADGSTLKSPRLILHSLRVGTHRLLNVPASIGPLASALLLGKSALDQLGTWSIDSQRKRLLLGVQEARQVDQAQQQPTGYEVGQSLPAAAQTGEVTPAEQVRRDVQELLAQACERFQSTRGKRANVGWDGDEVYETTARLTGCGEMSLWKRVKRGDWELRCEVLPNTKGISEKEAGKRTDARLVLIAEALPKDWRVTRRPDAMTYQPRFLASDPESRIELSVHVVPRVDGSFDATLKLLSLGTGEPQNP